MQENILYHLQNMVSNKGNNISEMSFQKPVLLVFLRHFGCTFCIQAIKDIKDKRSEIESNGTEIVFVHMSSNKTIESYFEKYSFVAPEHISDPSCHFYKGFGLMKGTFRQIFGLANWIKGFQSDTFDRITDENDLGDTFQMPGIFLVYKGDIVNSFIHNKISDRPDYLKLSYMGGS